MVTEDENLSELVDKAKMKEMQREVKDLERRRLKWKSCMKKCVANLIQNQKW